MAVAEVADVELAFKSGSRGVILGIMGISNDTARCKHSDAWMLAHGKVAPLLDGYLLLLWQYSVIS